MTGGPVPDPDIPTAGASVNAEVVVVGSINQDVTVAVPRLPRPGETVSGGDRRLDAGGKGANQAVAAARLGRRVALVGRVGADDDGVRLKSGLGDEGVDAAHLTIDPNAPTGAAFIAVEPGGENMIMVSPGANARVDATDVAAAAGLLGGAAVTLMQLEIGDEAVAAAIAASGGLVVLNPAPARALSDAVLASAHVLVPNRTELAQFTGSPEPVDVDDAAALARALPGDATVIVTLGAAGALVVRGRSVDVIPAPDVSAVDATAAGDAFCGALADALVRGESIGDAARWAVCAGAVAVTRHGARSSLPRRADVTALHDATFG